ncbi:diiron oxygenase [Nocardia sp. NPDC060259]|uniref:diiron oxygenase n=1 Tax=Nocardia sp. NPDC060259 TaxID=3347088 RepID=UPI0036603486
MVARRVKSKAGRWGDRNVERQRVVMDALIALFDQADPGVGRLRKFVLSLLFAPTMRIVCDLIAVPTRRFRADCDIPRSVVREVFWKSEHSRDGLRAGFADVRMLATDLGLLNPASRVLWKICRIDGDASRYRSEPARTTGSRIR